MAQSVLPTRRLLRTSAAIFGLIALSSTAAWAQVCDLDCQNNAPCAFTPVDSNLPSVNGMHCLCSHGWTGVRCEVEYETCDGHHDCQWGGQCVPGTQPDAFGNDQLVCDCTNAFDDGGFHMVGRFCEAREENYCFDNSGDFYCINGGQCNPSFPSAGEPCICDDDYFGVHCEYRRADAAGVSVPSMTSNHEQQECTLDCGTGTCIFNQNGLEKNPTDLVVLGAGAAAANNNNNNNNNNMQCLCPAGFAGNHCEIRRTPCGPTDYCFHGGECIERAVDGGQVVLHHCDCRPAATNEASYAGRFCQYQATSYCSKSFDLNQHLFCVNGGTCREDPKKGCDCEPHFAGFSCEFVKSQPPPAQQQQPQPDVGVPAAENNDTTLPQQPAATGPSQQQQQLQLDPAESYQCNLDCQNEGVCRNGLQDLGYLSAIAQNAPHLVDNLRQQQPNEQQFMHCVCADGWTGLLCEEKLNVCGNNEHLCLHGSICVKDGDNDEHACDCAAADSRKADTFVGDHCEHPVNDLCTLTKPGPGQPLLFCVNGGVCLDKVPIGDPHPGCLCDSGFSGPHCELSNRTQAPAANVPADQPIPPPSTATNTNTNTNNNAANPSDGSSPDDDDRATAGEIVAILFLVAILIPIAILIPSVYLRKRRQRNNNNNILTDNLRWASSYKDSPPSDELNLHNLSPRRGSLSRFQDDDDVPDDTTPSSSTDPFSTHLAPKQQPQQQQQRQQQKQRTRRALPIHHKRGDSHPQVDIGPPRDEDGHELHNVEIL